MPPNSQAALQNLTSYQQSMQKPIDVITSREKALGVPGAAQQVSGLRQAITNTTNMLNQIPQGVMGRTGQSLVTTGQANRIIQNETAPVAENLRTQGQQYSESQSAYDRLIAQAQAQAQAELQGQENQVNALTSIYGNLYKREQDELARQLEQQKIAEAQRQFNASLARSGSGGGGGITLGGGGGSRATSGSTSLGAGAAAPASSPQGKAYDFVANMRDRGASASAIVSDFNAAKNWYEKTGDLTDYYKLLYYKQIFPNILGNASFNQQKGLRF